MTPDQQNPPPHTSLPTTHARQVGRDGKPVLDENGNPVMVPVVPPDNAAIPPPGTIHRQTTGPDGSVGEQTIITPE